MTAKKAPSKAAVDDDQQFIEGWKAAKLDGVVQVLEKSVEERARVVLFPSACEVILPLLHAARKDKRGCKANATIVHMHWAIATRDEDKENK